MLKAITIALALCFALSLPAQAGQNVPDTASGIAEQLDAQLAERLQLLEGPAKGTTLILSTPVDLGNLEQSSPLARLVAEELAMWFVSNGYRVQEVRKTKNILLDPKNGELGLSRDIRFVDSRYQKNAVTLTGTYTQTTKHVRFNIRLLHAPTGEVLAMAAGTVKITPETAELLDAPARQKASRVRPSVDTRFAPMRMGQDVSAYAPVAPVTPVRSFGGTSTGMGSDILDFTE